MEVDSSHRVAVETRVEEVLPVLDLGAFGKGQFHRVLERLTDAEIAVTTPDRDAHWPTRLPPLHVLDNRGVRRSDHIAQVREHGDAPAAWLRDDGIDLFWDGRAAAHGHY